MVTAWCGLENDADYCSGRKQGSRPLMMADADISFDYGRASTFRSSGLLPASDNTSKTRSHVIHHSSSSEKTLVDVFSYVVLRPVARPVFLLHGTVPFIADQTDMEN